MSNNPFRNRIASQISPTSETSPRPISTNPFLDASEIGKMTVDSDKSNIAMNHAVDKTNDVFVCRSR